MRFERGLPQRIYRNDGTEFVSAAMDLWAYTNGVILDFSAAASRRTTPRLNRSMANSGKVLNVHWFASLEDALQKIDAFR